MTKRTISAGETVLAIFSPTVCLPLIRPPPPPNKTPHKKKRVSRVENDANAPKPPPRRFTKLEQTTPLFALRPFICEQRTSLFAWSESERQRKASTFTRQQAARHTWFVPKSSALNRSITIKPLLILRVCIGTAGNTMDVKKNIANGPPADGSAHGKKILPAPFKNVANGPRVDGSAHARTSFAPFNPTCSHAQNVAIQLLNLSSDDVLFDLGCGDGRFLMTAAEKHLLLRCVGIEINPVYAQRAKEAVKVGPEDIMHRIDIREGDIMGAFDLVETANISSDILKPLKQLSLLGDATAIFLFLLPKGMEMVRPILEGTMKRRANESKNLRIASYMFSIKGWKPVAVDLSTKGDAAVYLYDSTSFTQMASDLP